MTLNRDIGNIEIDIDSGSDKSLVTSGDISQFVSISDGHAVVSKTFNILYVGQSSSTELYSALETIWRGEYYNSSQYLNIGARTMGNAGIASILCYLRNNSVSVQIGGPSASVYHTDKIQLNSGEGCGYWLYG